MATRGRFSTVFWIMLSSLLFSVCREPFEIEYEVQDEAPILIVDGYINAGGTESIYELGYARPLSDRQNGIAGNIPLGNALVTIESENGEKFAASGGAGSGRYVIRHPLLDRDQRYRLRIQTGPTEYLSDFVPVRISPEITGIEWERNEDGVRILVSTADPANNTHYYRWEYEETWKYYSQVITWLIVDGNQVRMREPHEEIHLCYISRPSSDIHIGTSEELANDAIHRFPLTIIPNLSDKLSDRYSILVKQIPLTALSYTYWKQLRESSQNLGDIFGPMPSKLQGNIVCTSDPVFHVVGIVEAVQVAKKRIYINRLDLPGFWAVENDYFDNCIVVDTLRSASWFATNPIATPVTEVSPNPNLPTVEGYFYINSRRCVDCAFRGGTYAPPAFWKHN